jgi:hypothetical protein
MKTLRGSLFTALLTLLTTTTFAQFNMSLSGNHLTTETNWDRVGIGVDDPTGIEIERKLHIRKGFTDPDFFTDFESQSVALRLDWRDDMAGFSVTKYDVGVQFEKFFIYDKLNDFTPFHINSLHHIGIGASYAPSRLTVETTDDGNYAAKITNNSDRGFGLHIVGGNGSDAESNYSLLRVSRNSTELGNYDLFNINGKTGVTHAREILVDLASWPDYVFEPHYALLDLKDLSDFIKENKHLPEVPSEKEVLENGIKLGEMNAILLKKIEELTLYVVQLNAEQDAQRALIDALTKQLQK